MKYVNKHGRLSTFFNAQKVSINKFKNIRSINTKRKLDDYQEDDNSDSNKKRRIEENYSDNNLSTSNKSEQDQNMSENQSNLDEYNESEDYLEEDMNESEQDQNQSENHSDSDESEHNDISSEHESEASDNNIRRPMGYLYSGSEESLPDNIPLASAIQTAEQALDRLSESRRNPDIPAEVLNSLESDVVKAVEHINKDSNVDENQVL